MTNQKVTIDGEDYFIPKNLSDTVIICVDCVCCGKPNWYYNGDSQDLTQQDIEALICWSCGARFLLFDCKIDIEILVEDQNVNVEYGKSREEFFFGCKLKRLLDLAKKLPKDLRADWQGTNHYELHETNEQFWLALGDMLSEDLQKLYLPDQIEGQRLGLVLDIVAEVSKVFGGK